MSKMSEYFELYLELSDVRASTAEIYRRAFELFALMAGVKDPAGYTPIDGQIYRKRLQGQYDSANSVNMYLRAIRGFFAWMVESKVIADNPMALVKTVRVETKGRPGYTCDEIGRIVEACPDLRWKAIVVLAASTGMRLGEILNLTIADVDYYDCRILITPKKKTAYTWEWQPKNGRTRTVPVSQETMDLLMIVQGTLPDGQPYLCVEPLRYAMLLQRDAVGRKPVNNFNRDFNRICIAAGVMPKTFHALRGSALSIMAKSLQPHELQAVAGHADYRTTDKYYVRPDHDFSDRVRSASYSQNGRYRT